MDRRHFILALSAGAALFGSLPAGAECGSVSAIEFVETLYQKQARLHAENSPPAQEDFFALFSRDMRKLMQAPRRPDPNVMLGPKLNAFFGWGVLPRTEMAIGKTQRVSGQEEGPATIGVAVTYRGTARKVLVHVVMEEDDWRIANIIYDNGKSLIAHYRDMTTQ